MKKTYTIIILLHIGILIQAQSDTIFLNNGEILKVIITEIGDRYIKYSYPNEIFSNELNKQSVSRIHFKSGRVEDFTFLNRKDVISCLDWENVEISSIPSEVQNLCKIEPIYAKAKGKTEFSNVNKMQAITTIRIKLQTAMLGGNVCFITNQNTQASGPWKNASSTIAAFAYSSEKVYLGDLSFGKYYITDAYALKHYAYDLTKLKIEKSSYFVEKDQISENNCFPILGLNIDQINKNISKYSIISANETSLILSAVETKNKGKKTYYNVFLEREN